MLAPDRLTGLRYLGLAGSIALAAGAYQAGALPGRAAADGLPGPGQAAGAIACLAGLIALTGAWWRIGQVTDRPGGPALSGRWILVTAAVWATPLALAVPLASRDVYAYACQGAIVRAGADPHLTGAADLPCPWLDSVPTIWRHAASPYGPLFSLLSAAAVAGSGGQLPVTVALLRVLALCGVVLAVWYGRRLAVTCGVSAGRAGWLGLASPLVAVHAVAGAHNDALMAGLIMTALGTAAAGTAERGATGTAERGASSGARRGGPTTGGTAVAGVALGLAIAVKATALVAAPFVALLAAASAGGDRPGRRRARGAGVVLGTAAVSYAALALISGLGLGFLRGLSRTGEPTQWTSVPTAVGMTVGYLLRLAGLESGYSAAVTMARGLGLAALAAVIAITWWWAWRAPTAPVRHAVAGAGVAFAAVAVLGPVFYPWYALTPLALLATCVGTERVRDWLAVASGGLAFLVLPNGAGLAARTKLPGAVLVTAAVIAGLAGAARRVRRAARAAPTRQESSAPGRSRRPDPRPGP